MSKDTNEQKKRKSVGRIILIIMMSVILLSIIAVAVLQFTGIYDFTPWLTKEKWEEVVKDGVSGESSVIYQENAVSGINTMISDYYNAMLQCDQNTLKACVLDDSIYDDMSGTMQKAMMYIGYENINVYTVPGVNAQEYVTYVMCNLSIAGVNSKPLNINCYYVVNTESGYKIDNGVHTTEVTEKMIEINSDPSIQELYQQVMEDTNSCIENDQSFADFYSEINSIY